jgi:NRPS condensation-like uncharacterized protein
MFAQHKWQILNSKLQKHFELARESDNCYSRRNEPIEAVSSHLNENTFNTRPSANGLGLGKLNRFQRTMLDWNDAHPYNAVHVVRVRAALDVERLRSVLEHTLENRGLTGLSLNRSTGTYHYHGGPVPCEIRVLEATGEEQSTLRAEIERQLNTPFILSEGFSPFRFFVTPGTGSFSLGLTYFHAVADAESSAHLMKEIFHAYMTRNNGAVAGMIYPPCFDNLLRHKPKVFARKLATIPSLVSQIRASSRPPYRNGQPTTSGFTTCSLGPEELRRLTTMAKSWGVTVNDLFLGLLMKALALVASDRTLAARRRKISVGCIVNTRRDLGLQNKPIFGLFLGSFAVAHEVPDEISLQALVLDLHRQTKAIKRRKLYLAAAMEMAVARFTQSLFSLERRNKFYHRYYPLWGGITNLNLNPLWPRGHLEEPINYLRAVSTSPATPLVLSVTTSGNTINIGFTYRSTAFLPAEMERVKNCFLEDIAKVGTVD